MSDRRRYHCSPSIVTTNKTHYAHSASGLDASCWHVLEDHLRSVGERAERLVRKFGARGYGEVSGIWHDIGKYPDDWQAYIRQGDEDASISDGELDTHRKRGPDHSSAGAIHALRRYGEAYLGLPIQFVIAGHHAGLADRESLRTRLLDPGKAVRYDMAIAEGASSILELSPDLGLPAQVARTRGDRNQQMRRFEMFVRMLFSALVDSDFLDTEAFVQGIGGVSTADVDTRQSWSPLSEYASVLTRYLDDLSARSPSSGVNGIRAEVLAHCRDAASRAPGVHTLTVPTGGGKTLSSLEFALRHAIANRLDRVVVALPYLSIIDQTASVFRRVFAPALGPNTIVEHHSSIDPERDTRANRLASENWDAPLVVTTQVQLFESLFASRTSRCRKLHSLARSVIVLDEVQTLPVKFLDPILDVLQQLTDTYGVSVMLMTATQPRLAARPLGAGHLAGFAPDPREIVPFERVESMFEELKRVEVRWPHLDHRVTVGELAESIAEHRQVLAVVDTRNAAELLTREVDKATDCIHLSARMCAVHRRLVIEEVRRRLREDEPCRLVSTQLIEAGVDVDFPIVFKSLAGLDSIAQAAGRCNREGKLDRGIVVVFNPENDPPLSLRSHRDITLVMLRNNPQLDLTSTSTFTAYFDRLYAQSERDSKAIQRSRADLKFEQVAADFRMVDDVYETVFVPFGKKGSDAIEAVRYGGPTRGSLRALQPFGVSVTPGDLIELQRVGAVERISDTVCVLISSIHYSDRFGILSSPDGSDFLAV